MTQPSAPSAVDYWAQGPVPRSGGLAGGGSGALVGGLAGGALGAVGGAATTPQPPRYNRY